MKDGVRTPEHKLIHRQIDILDKLFWMMIYARIPQSLDDENIAYRADDVIVSYASKDRLEVVVIDMGGGGKNPKPKGLLGRFLGE